MTSIGLEHEDPANHLGLKHLEAAAQATEK